MTETNPNFLIVHTSWYEEHIDNMVFIASKELDFFKLDHFVYQVP